LKIKNTVETVISTCPIRTSFHLLMTLCMHIFISNFDYSYAAGFN